MTSRLSRRPVRRLARAACTLTVTLGTAFSMTGCAAALVAAPRVERELQSAAGSSPDATPTPTDIRDCVKGPDAEHPTACEVIDKAQDVAKKATSVEWHSTFNDSTAASTMTTRGDLDADPVEQKTVNSKGPGKGTYEVRIVDGDMYELGDENYWGTPKLKDTWVHSDAAGLPDSDRSSLSARQVIDHFVDDADPLVEAARSSDAEVSRASLNGVETFKVAAPDEVGTIWIAADGSYRLLQMDDATYEGGGHERSTFSRWDEKFDIAKPAKSVELSDQDLPEGSASKPADA